MFKHKRLIYSLLIVIAIGLAALLATQAPAPDRQVVRPVSPLLFASPLVTLSPVSHLPYIVCDTGCPTATATNRPTPTDEPSPTPTDTPRPTP